MQAPKAQQTRSWVSLSARSSIKRNMPCQYIHTTQERPIFHRVYVIIGVRIAPRIDWGPEYRKIVDE